MSRDGRTWVTREEIAELYEVRAFQVGAWSVQSIERMQDLLNRAELLRWTERRLTEQGREKIRQQMDTALPSVPRAVVPDDFSWGELVVNWFDEGDT